jgi:hypothetical protein
VSVHTFASAGRDDVEMISRAFMASFDAALDYFRNLLADLGAGHLDLPDLNFDTGSASSKSVLIPVQ